jgi:murein DD-endopeptidase MepM/ murein hydrolase activator NlpD
MAYRHPIHFKLAALVLLVIGIQGCASSRRADRVDNLPSGWPVSRKAAVVSSNFGAPRGGSGHQGIDLAAPEGSAVKTTADGKVIEAERSKRYGRTVLIDHGRGWQTRYAHLKRIKVDRGERVKRGENIGTVGRSGNATGFHLHYEVLRHGAPVDPWPYLDR